jgi:serine/threonine protein kinase
LKYYFIDKREIKQFNTLNEIFKIVGKDLNLLLKNMIKIISIVLYMHSLNVFHGSIIPRNFLFDKNNRIKFVDFSSS